jgi:hypothetical protein
VTGTRFVADGKPMTNNDSKTDHDANIRSADQRATALAAVSSIAASLALSGAAIIVDTGKLMSPSWIRPAFGSLLIVAVLMFSLSAFIAVLAHQQKREACKPLVGVSNNKHARVNLSMWFLLVGMLCVLLLTGVSMFATGALPQVR